MEKFNKVISTAVPLQMENIDTDQIIPARFLKATDKEGFGDHLFHDWRFDENENPISSFPLNSCKYKGKILVVGHNFGCGSSREHAAWAIKAYGFNVVISSFFADIFKGNALNNGLLPIEIPAEKLNELFTDLKNHPLLNIEVDLEQQLLKFNQHQIHFDIDPYKKTCMINGLDDIDFLVGMKDKIEKFEKERDYQF